MRYNGILAIESLISFAFAVRNRNKIINAYKSINVSELHMPLLIIAPHPDDEWLSSAGLINEISKVGKSLGVNVIVMSNGEAFLKIDKKWKKQSNIPLWAERQLETRSGLRFLTGEPIEPIFVGFSDGKISEPFISKDISTIVANYNLLRNLILEKGYKTIIFPHFSDDHPDHWGTSILTLLVLYSLSMETPSKVDENTYLMYLTHFDNFPIRGNSRKLSIIPPSSMCDSYCQEVHLSDNSYRLKKTALKFFKSQNVDLGNALMLRNFIKRNELFYKLHCEVNLDLHTMIPTTKKDYNGKLVTWNFIFSKEGMLKYVNFDKEYRSSDNYVSTTFANYGNYFRVYNIKIR